MTDEATDQHFQLGLYRMEADRKLPLAKVSLKPGNDHAVFVAVDSYVGDPETIRDIVFDALAAISDGLQGQAFETFSDLKPVLIDHLNRSGHFADEVQGADAMISIQFDLRTGEMLGSHEALTPFGEDRHEINAKVFQLVSQAFESIPNHAAEVLQATIAAEDWAGTLAILKSSEQSGAAHLPPTEALYQSIYAIDLNALTAEDEFYVRKWRLSVAEGLGRSREAKDEAEELLGSFVGEFSFKDQANLELVIAAAYSRNGRSEAAFDIWKRLMDNPELLTAEQRGLIWWSISMFHPLDSGKSREAAKLSADAYLEAGDKGNASRSLMRLADGLLHEEPSRAINAINDIVSLLAEKSLQDRELFAALMHARANRLAKLGAHIEAAHSALEAAERRRGLLGAEEQLISSLILAAIQFAEAGDDESASRLRAEADAIVEAVQAQHFLMAKRLDTLFSRFDDRECQAIMADATAAGKVDVVAYAIVARAIHAENISDSKRLALLEEALEIMEAAKLAEFRKQPVLAAIATQLRKLGHDERAEAWLIKMLEVDPFDLYALSTIIDSFKRRELWGDAAVVLERQIKLRGWVPDISMEYGRCLFEAGDYSRSIDALTHVIAETSDDLQRQEARKLRELAVDRGGRPREPSLQLPSTRLVTRDEFERALDDFASFVSGDKRMRFWRLHEGVYKWVESPEKRGQDLLHAFLKARFSNRVTIFEELNTGAGRLDVFVQFLGGLSFILELKMCGGGYSSNYAAAGETQLLHYMKNRNSHLGYLIVFDSRKRDFGNKLLAVGVEDTVVEHFIDLRTSVEDIS